MTDNKKRFILLLVALMLLSIGLLVGCGENVAENRPPVDLREVDETVEVAPASAPADAETETARERELAERVHELEARLQAMEKRELPEPRPEPAPEPEPIEQVQVIDEPRIRQLPVEPVPAPEPEPVVRAVWVTLPASTSLDVEFIDSLSSQESLAGDPVRTMVANDVVRGGLVVIPAGSEVLGTVTEVRQGKKIGGQARLAVEFDTLQMPSGEQVAIQSSIEFVGKRQRSKDAATIGGSAAGGAILGRVLSGDDKDKGTVLGAVVGAAIGTAVAANNGTDPVLIESGAIKQLLLYEPLRLSVLDESTFTSPLASKN